MVGDLLDRRKIHCASCSLEAVGPAKDIRKVYRAPLRAVEGRPDRLEMLPVLDLEGSL